MESFLANSIEVPMDIFKSKESSKLKFLRLLNLLFLTLFSITWVLNFIWIGWYGVFTVLTVYAWIYCIFNGLFVLADHNQRTLPFRSTKRTMPIVYITSGIAMILTVAFFIYGCYLLQKHYAKTEPTDEEL